MKEITTTYWTEIGRDEFGRLIPGHVTEKIQENPMHQPTNITQQTNFTQPAAAPLQAAQPQPQIWTAPGGGWQQPTQTRANPFPIVALMIGVSGLFGFIATLSRVNELQADNSALNQRVTELQSQIRDRDIQIQSYERMAAITR